MRCDVCGVAFKPPYRKNKRFCSDKCRVQNARRSEAVEQTAPLEVGNTAPAEKIVAKLVTDAIGLGQLAGKTFRTCKKGHPYMGEKCLQKGCAQ